jgi:hypothetical protein
MEMGSEGFCERFDDLVARGRLVATTRTKASSRVAGEEGGWRFF